MLYFHFPPPPIFAYATSIIPEAAPKKRNEADISAASRNKNEGVDPPRRMVYHSQPESKQLNDFMGLLSSAY
jgi:hypothetical protein